MVSSIIFTPERCAISAPPPSAVPALPAGAPPLPVGEGTPLFRAAQAASTAKTAATGGGILAGLKSVWKFLQGDWGTSVGKAYKDAKKAGLTKGITDFDWKKAYGDYHAKAAADAAAEAAKIASGEVKKGILSKCLGFLKRNLSPILTAVAYGPQIVKAFANDGVGEGFKEIAKAAIAMTAFAIGGVIVGMIGGGWFLGLVIPALLNIFASKASNMVLGESKAEQRAALEAKSNEVQQQAQINAQSIAKNDPVMESIRKRVMEDKYCTSPFLSTTARTQYSV